MQISFDALRKMPDGADFTRNGAPARKIRSVKDEDGTRVSYEMVDGDLAGIAFEDSKGDAVYAER